MPLTPLQTVITIAAVAAGAILTRFLPFWLFPEKKEPPAIVTKLGQMLPPAMMGLLTVYCLRNVSVISFPFGLPEGIALTVIVLLHLWKHNTLLSIGVGTAVYMLLLQCVFV